MPFLWKHFKQLLTNDQSPSPKHNEMSAFRGSIERASVLSFLKKRIPSSMTVEAAVALPLFLFFFINLSCAIEMIRLHGTLQLALWDVGNRMSVYGYAVENADFIRSQAVDNDTGKNLWDDMADIALSYTYVKQEVITYAGADYLKQSPLSGGIGALQFWESDLFGTEEGGETEQSVLSGDILDIVMTYPVSPWLEIPAVRPFRMANRYYGHLWTGYEIAAHGGEPDEPNEDPDVVYITDNASVYHESLECTHLKLSIREVTMEEALSSRNEEGKRYRECSKCGKKQFQGTVFIGREGEFYHYDRGCSGLKRTVHTISRQEAAGYRPCSRCGGKR